MGRAQAAQRQLASLPVARTCLRVINVIDAATRWAVFASHDARLADRIRAQVSACLASLAERGAFATDRYVADCDVGVSGPLPGISRGFDIFVSFQPLGATEPVAFTIHQAVAGSRVSSTSFAPA